MSNLVLSAGRALRGALAVVACLPTVLHAQRASGVLQGRVLSGDVAVPSAAILISGGRATLARVDGRYRISLPAGRYVVRAQRIGYASGVDSVEVRAGETSTLNFRIERAASMFEAVSTIGSRLQDRAVIDAPHPVDVLPAADLKATGRTESAAMLEALAPSITVARPAAGDGSDVARLVSLRGLGSDRTLVLVNGRRRHASALVASNGAFARGGTGTDVDAIPSSMIDRVEVLRGSAAAAYGIEAIGGVVNIVLKSGVHGDATFTGGRRGTTYNGDDATTRGTYGFTPYTVTDGRVGQTAIDKGIVFGERGFLHGALELRDRAYTNRALPDLYHPASSATATPQELITQRHGEAAATDLQIFFNGSNLFANGLELYGTAGGSRRAGENAEVFRSSADPRTNLSLYPTGFMPVTRATSTDAALSLGVRGALEDLEWDLHTSVGANRIGYRALNSENPAITTAPPTEFDAGALRSGLLTASLDLSQAFMLFEELRLTFGAEVRQAAYEIVAGEEPSYRFNTSTARGFSQGFRGFTPAQASRRTRFTPAAYGDVEIDVTPALLVGLAARVERPAGFGTVGAATLTGRWEAASKTMLRGNLGVGSRAPSLAQEAYTGTVTDLVNGEPRDVSVLRSTDALALALHASPLRSEHYLQYGAGFALEATRALSFSLDYFHVNITDRLGYTGTFVEATGAATTFFSANGSPEVTAARYLRNGVDTRTDGVNLTGNYVTSLFDGSLRLLGGVVLDRTTLTHYDATSGFTVAGFTEYDRIERTRIEKGQPASRLLLSGTWSRDQLGTMLRVHRWGEVTRAGSVLTDTLDQTFAAKWLVDGSLSYTLARKYTFTIGADNLFDVYPDRNNVPGDPAIGVPGNGYYRIYPYNAASPFGFSGRFGYGRLSIYL